MEAFGQYQVFDADSIQGARLESLLDLATDMHRFAQSHWTMIEKAPLQTYSSALIFSPSCSRTRELFTSEEPDWIVQKSRSERNWDSCLTTVFSEYMIFSVAYSPDGHHIVSGSGDGTIKVWDAETGAETLTLQGHTDWVWSVAFDEDCKFITSKSDDQTIKVWDAETGACISTCEGSREPTGEAIFSPDKRYRTTRFSFDGILHIKDSGNDNEILTLRGHGEAVTSVDFSPDGRYIASGSKDKTIKIWDAETGNEISTLQGHLGDVFSVCFSPDSHHLVSGSADATTKIWIVEGSAETSFLQGLFRHRGAVNSVALSLDGRRVASGSDDCTVRIWDTETGKMLQTLEYNSEIRCVSFSPSGSHIGARSRFDSVVISDVESGATMSTWDAGWDDTFALSLDCCHIAMVYQSDILVHDVKNPESELTLSGHSGYVTSLAFSPTSRHIAASSSSNGMVKIWNVKTGDEMSTINVSPETSLLRFDHTGAVLYTSTTSLLSSNSFRVLSPPDSTWPLNTDSSQLDFVLPEMRQIAYGVREHQGSEDIWITWRDQDILRLPPEFATRSTPSDVTWDILPDMISIGNLSGRSCGSSFLLSTRATPLLMRTSRCWNNAFSQLQNRKAIMWVAQEGLHSKFVVKGLFRSKGFGKAL